MSWENNYKVQCRSVLLAFLLLTFKHWNMATNINVELFKKYAPKKKLEIIEKLGPNEVMNVSTATITRIVKEAGTNMYKSRNKRMYISRERQRGNSWNSTVEAVELIKGKLYLDIYYQFSNTDCNTSELVTDFMKRGDFTGSVVRSDRYGNDRHYYFTYSEGSKQRVIRSILEEYVYTKYATKLKDAV